MCNVRFSTPQDSATSIVVRHAMCYFELQSCYWCFAKRKNFYAEAVVGMSVGVVSRLLYVASLAVALINFVFVVTSIIIFAFVMKIMICLHVTVHVIAAITETNTVTVKVDCYYQIVTFCLMTVWSCKSLVMGSMPNSHFHPHCYDAQRQIDVELPKWCSALGQ